MKTDPALPKDNPSQGLCQLSCVFTPRIDLCINIGFKK